MKKIILDIIFGELSCESKACQIKGYESALRYFINDIFLNFHDHKNKKAGQYLPGYKVT